MELISLIQQQRDDGSNDYMLEISGDNMNYFGTFCTVYLKHVQEAYTVRGSLPLAMLIIIFKPNSEAGSYDQVFYFPKEVFAKQSR